MLSRACFHCILFRSMVPGLGGALHLGEAAGATVVVPHGVLDGLHHRLVRLLGRREGDRAVPFAHLDLGR